MASTLTWLVTVGKDEGCEALASSRNVMAKVVFLDHGREIDVELGTSILQAAKKSGAPEGDACGGVCACSTCHVYVEEGSELLSEAEEDEEDILDKAFDVRMTSRLGCQAKVERDGVIVVRITRESLDAFYNEHPDVPRPE
jgi:2Fe-2S ferredoxin